MKRACSQITNSDELERSGNLICEFPARQCWSDGHPATKKRNYLRMKIKSSVLILFLASLTGLKVHSQTVKQEKLIRFDLQSSEFINDSGEKISQPEYSSKSYWFPVKVPSTVLTGLVANRVYPDPYSGMNNMYIPDANDEFNKIYNLEQYSHIPNVGNPWKKPYWYRTTFTIPETDKGRHFQLIFKGIN